MTKPQLPVNNLPYNHGMRGTRAWSAWARMKDRCDNFNLPGYENYGGRGITYDPRWADFREFILDMGECLEGRSLGRIDNDKGYYKENCRWEIRTQQNRNRRTFKNNTSGISGVSLDGGWWRARAYHEGTRVTLYKGHDFFEACCARKSWEALYGRRHG